MNLNEINEKILALDPKSPYYDLILEPKDLLVTEERLKTWKRNASAGAVIVGSVSCRYLIVKKSVVDSRENETKYGFVNIDHAGWEVCEPTFKSTDELIEWFASNIENPVVTVIPEREVKTLTPGYEFI